MTSKKVKLRGGEHVFEGGAYLLFWPRGWALIRWRALIRGWALITILILLVASCWVFCDELATHPGRRLILLVASCWVPCDGLASHPGEVVILRVASC